MTRIRAIEDRLWDRVDKSGGPDACWPWLGSGSPDGHGRCRLPTPSRRRVYVHRVSWELHNGPIPDGLEVCHRCDNPPCVNPTHLFLGTRRDNALDAARKGRLRTGEDHPGARLTDAQVATIRASVASGAAIRDIAAEYGVRATWVWAVARRRTRRCRP